MLLFFTPLLLVSILSLFCSGSNLGCTEQCHKLESVHCDFLLGHELDSLRKDGFENLCLQTLSSQRIGLDLPFEKKKKKGGTETQPTMPSAWYTLARTSIVSLYLGTPLFSEYFDCNRVLAMMYG